MFRSSHVTLPVGEDEREYTFKSCSLAKIPKLLSIKTVLVEAVKGVTSARENNSAMLAEIVDKVLDLFLQQKNLDTLVELVLDSLRTNEPQVTKEHVEDLVILSDLVHGFILANGRAVVPLMGLLPKTEGEGAEDLDVTPDLGLTDEEPTPSKTGT